MFNDLTIGEAKTHIAKLSKVLRNASGISQEQLAEQLEMSRLTIQNMERSKNVTMDTFLKVLRHFELLEKFDDFIVKSIEDSDISPLY